MTRHLFTCLSKEAAIRVFSGWRWVGIDWRPFTHEPLFLVELVEVAP